MNAICRRHLDGSGPPWCQDCHGVHEVPRPEPVYRESRPAQLPPWYLARKLPPEEWPGREERLRILGEVLSELRAAKERKAGWYMWVLERRRR